MLSVRESDLRAVFIQREVKQENISKLALGCIELQMVLM